MSAKLKRAVITGIFHAGRIGMKIALYRIRGNEGARIPAPVDTGEYGARPFFKNPGAHCMKLAGLFFFGVSAAQKVAYSAYSLLIYSKHGKINGIYSAKQALLTNIGIFHGCVFVERDSKQRV